MLELIEYEKILQICKKEIAYEMVQLKKMENQLYGKKDSKMSQFFLDELEDHVFEKRERIEGMKKIYLTFKNYGK